jgi:hypothetical protein
MKTKRPGRQGEFWEWELAWEAQSFNCGEEGDPLWLVCVTCFWTDSILARRVFAKEPTPDDLWEVLLEAMERPETSEPRQPKRLMVRPGEGWEALRRKLEGIGITLVRTKDLDCPDGLPEWIDSVWTTWEENRRKRP